MVSLNRKKKLALTADLFCEPNLSKESQNKSVKIVATNSPNQASEVDKLVYEVQKREFIWQMLEKYSEIVLKTILHHYTKPK